MRYPKICIIVLNWNGVKDTLECLESISSMNYTNYEVIVVDNGSTDMSVDIIRSRHPDLTIIKSEKNLGYTGGNNLGIQSAMKHGADYIWVLNNDTIVEGDCLKNMVIAAESDCRIGILSPVIFYNNQRDRMQFCGTYLNTKNGSILEESKDGKEGIEIADGFVFVLYGTAMLIKRKVIEKIGLLDDNFFAYFEDYDYSLRAHKNNFRSMVAKSATIYHKDASSTGGANSPIRTYFYYRNLLLFWKKHLKGAALLKLKYKYLRKSIGAAILYRAMGNRLSAYACLDGIWDGLTGSGGAKNPENKMPFILKRVLFLFHPYGKKLTNFYAKNG